MVLRTLTEIPVLKRFLPSIIKKLKIRRIKYVYKNITFFLDLRYLVDRRFYLNGYDEENISIINQFIKEKKIEYFIDIGSCWGIYSIQLAKANLNLKVISFDAFKNNIERLKEMLSKNNIINVKPYNYAIGEYEKVIELSVNESFSPNYSKDLKGKYKIKVNQKKLDNFLEIKNSKIVIKIDVERSEEGVLRGSKKFLQNNSCLIQIESNAINQSVILNIFREFGYRQTYFEIGNDDLYFTNFEY